MTEHWIKVCGLRQPEHIEAAIEAGADAIGLVFAESPRAVTIDTAVLLAGLARGQAQVVAVMRHPEPALAHEVQARVAPDLLQTDAGDYETFDLLPGIRALPVYRDSEAMATLPRQFLFEGAQSGTGETADWGQAATLARDHELVLAGGLSPDNVATAIHDVRPWGVDVSSGVERTRGEKDPDRIHAFVAAARAAFGEH